MPTLLREAGLRLETLSECYGVPADERVLDETWLEHAGRSGLVVFMKDARIRYNPAEREAVRTHRVRCFCLSSQQLTGDEMAGRFLANLGAIADACTEDGPFIYSVHANRIIRLATGDQ